MLITEDHHSTVSPGYQIVKTILAREPWLDWAATPSTLVQLTFLALALLTPCQPQHSVILVEIIHSDY